MSLNLGQYAECVSVCVWSVVVSTVHSAYTDAEDMF